MNAQFAALQAQLALIGIPAISGAVSANVQAVIAARAENGHDRSGVAYAVVPRADGTPPPNWPAGFDRFALIRGPIAVIDALLNDLPGQSTTAATRSRFTLARSACEGEGEEIFCLLPTR